MTQGPSWAHAHKFMGASAAGSTPACAALPWTSAPLLSPFWLSRPAECMLMGSIACPALSMLADPYASPYPSLMLLRIVPCSANRHPRLPRLFTPPCPHPLQNCCCPVHHRSRRTSACLSPFAHGSACSLQCLVHLPHATSRQCTYSVAVSRGSPYVTTPVLPDTEGALARYVDASYLTGGTLRYILHILNTCAPLSLHSPPKKATLAARTEP